MLMVKIIPHRHCTICGKSIESNETFCSDRCKKRYDDAQRRQKLMFVLFLVLIFIILLLPQLGAG